MSSEDIEKKGLGAEESNRMYESKGAAGQPENREADNTAGADNPSEEGTYSPRLPEKRRKLKTGPCRYRK